MRGRYLHTVWTYLRLTDRGVEMTIFDILLILLALATVAGIVTALVAMFFRRWALAARSLVAIVSAWVLYLGIGTAVALRTPQHILSFGEDRCFDEMCFAVMGYKRIPSTNAGKSFYLVDVRISNRSRGRAQREIGRKGVLVDRAGRVYEVSRQGMHAPLLFPALTSRWRPAKACTQSLFSSCPKISATRVLRWAAT